MKLLIILILVSTYSFAGNSDGGGGRGVVCYDHDNNIQSVTLLDLYEGNILYDFESIESDASVEDILKLVAKKVPDSETLIYSLTSIYSSFKILPKNMRLNNVSDSDEIFIPADCKIEQLAFMQGQSKVFVVGDFWKKMDNVNKAALVYHEMIWLHQRIAGRTKSKRARNKVARFFDKKYKFSKVWPNNRFGNVSCGTTNLDHQVNKITIASAFLVNQEAQHYHLEFRALGGVFLDNNFYADIKYEMDFFDQLLAQEYDSDIVDPNSTEEFSFPVYQEGHGESFIVTITSTFEKLSNGKYKKNSILRVVDLEFPDKVINESALRCFQDQDDADVTDVTDDFFKEFSGKYIESKFQESIEILSGRKMIASYMRQVGVEGSNRIPYPTTCGYKKVFEIISVSKRNNPIPYQGKNVTHYLNLKTIKYEHDDEIYPGSSQNQYCINHLNESNNYIDDLPSNHPIDFSDRERPIFKHTTFIKN